jgi:hypothetical protein
MVRADPAKTVPSRTEFMHASGDVTGRARILTGAFPVVLIVCPPRWADGWVEDLDRQVSELFGRKERYALIIDATRITGVPSAKDRKHLTDWLTRPEHLARQRRWNVGSSTILSNALIRGALQAIYWVWTPPAPQHAARDIDDAWAWSLEKLRAEGIPLPKPEAELLDQVRRELRSAHAATGGMATPPLR